jgi:integrase
MGKSERTRRAKEIINESGADSPELFRQVRAVNLGTTFRQQSAWWLEHMKTRKRRPVKASTAMSWKSHLAWINPVIGDMPLASVNNLALKGLVTKMSEAGFTPKTMCNYLQVAKMVVGSALDEQGEEIHPRKWNHSFMDLPEVKNQRTPTFTADEVVSIISAATGQFRVLYSLLAGTGMRIGEALALEVRDICEATVIVRQGVFNGVVQSPKTASGVREIDVHSSLAAVLRDYIGERKSGFLFPSASETPLSRSNILRRSLHSILVGMGREKCGFHSFRRFRVTHLRKQRVPEDLLRFWVGHAGASVTDLYSKVKEDVEFRRICAENVGLGFDIPPAPAAVVVQKPLIAPSCTKTLSLVHAA